MNEFEKACDEVNRDFTTEKENVIEFLNDSKIATVTFAQGRFITKVKNLAEKYPDRVKITAQNPDGSVVAHIPVSAIKLSIIERVLSEEQKKIIAERLNKGREKID